MDELQVLDERRQRMRRADYVRAAVLDRLPVLIPQANQSMWVAHGRGQASGPIDPCSAPRAGRAVAL